MEQRANTIRAYMLANWRDHLDPRTNEINMTTLAEDACQHFNDYEKDDSIDQTYYDISYEVALRIEKELKDKQ